MKRFLISAGVLLAIVALIVFNKMTSKNKVTNVYAEAKKGAFEITVTSSGELIAEHSLDIFGPSIGEQQNQGQGQRGGGPQPQRGGGGGGGMQGRGGDMRVMDLKILDIVPEGTIVKAGDYIAQLDKSAYDNSLKDALDNMKTLESNVEMEILDTAVALSGLRDEIKNKKFAVEEAKIVLEQSKFEPPATIRKAEMSLDRTQRSLEQQIQGYNLKVAQTLASIRREKIRLERGTRLVQDLQDYLAKFTITAPTDGMVIYKKERNGTKRKAGSNVNPFDLIIATLPDLSSMLSKIYVNEIDISKIKMGQEVGVKVDAFPDKSYKGKVVSIANVGEQLPNSDSKMFEVQIRLDESDNSLRPSMTTGNKIIIKTFDNVTYIPAECVRTGADSIPFVYEKRGTKQIVVLGEANDKNIIVEQGIEPGTSIYMISPANPETFRLAGHELIPVIRERNKAIKLENEKYRREAQKVMEGRLY